jgi:hypothetical protein
MNRKWMPITAGVLYILSGAFQLWAAFYALMLFVQNDRGLLSYNIIIFIIGSTCLITSIVAIAGGIYIIQRKKRYFAYLGALAAYIPLVIPTLFLYGLEGNPVWWCIMLIGIGALILSLVEKEFKLTQNSTPRLQA